MLKTTIDKVQMCGDCPGLFWFDEETAECEYGFHLEVMTGGYCRNICSMVDEETGEVLLGMLHFDAKEDMRYSWVAVRPKLCITKACKEQIGGE